MTIQSFEQGVTVGIEWRNEEDNWPFNEPMCFRLYHNKDKDFEHPLVVTVTRGPYESLSDE